jgi:osmotically-inducible protein OsmY
MKKPLYLLSFGLALALAATGQTSSQTQTPPVNPTTPATQVGSGAQTKAGTPVPSSTTSNPTGQVNPTGTAQPPAQSTAPNSTTGGVAGAAGASATQNPAPEGSPSGIATVSDSDLESQIQNALNKEPTLSGDNTHVKISGDTIELDGNVASNKDKTTATRIVQSYAGSKKLVNRLTIGGNGSTTSHRNEQPDSSDRTRPASTTNPATNPEPNKGSQPPNR